MTALNHIPDRFVLLPFRKGEKDTPDWSLCSKYIATNHSSNNTTSVDDALKSMAAYHNTIVKTCTADAKNAPNETFIEHTLKEYCKLVAMAQAHLPLNGGKVSKKLHYMWCDSFDDWNKYDTMNANAELVSCVYNLAASYVTVAVGQAQTGTVEGVKDAFKNFQNAAGYYTMVADLSNRMPPEQLVKGDMKKESLQMLVKVSLAQAHHCGYLKAEEAMKGKQEMLSKIAMEGSKIYEEAHSMLKSSAWYATKETAAKDAEITLLACRHIMEARANLHLCVSNEEAGEMGVALAYYKRAQSCLSKVPKMPTQALTQWVNSIVTSVNRAHEAAEKANTSVYYARVPKEVPNPEGLVRPLGQALELPSFVNFESKRGVDPFFGIIPAHIAASAAAWRDKQRNRVQVCNSAAVNGRKTSTNTMQQLGVMAVIQTMSGEVHDKGRVPEPLRSSILKLRGGDTDKTKAVTQKLVDHVQACQELQKVADAKLQEIKAELAREKQDDAHYVEAYGEKMWRAVCPRSEDTPDYNTIMASYSESKQSLQQYFVGPFAAARKTLDENLRDVARLDWKMSDLDALMPFVETKEARQQSTKVMAHVAALKAIMDEKERLENEQLAEQRELMDMIESDSVVFGLSAVESTERDAILAAETKRISDAIEKINEKTRAQAALVTRAEKDMEELSKLQSTDPVAQEIQKVSNSLENACNVYTELIKDFEGIAQYASKLIEGLDTTINNAKSFRTVRKFSAEEQQSRLDAQIAQKMAEMKGVESEIEQSRLRQQQLQQQIASMQAGQQQPMQPPPQGRPPQQQPVPIMSSAEDRPPTYDAVMGGGPSYQPPAPANDAYSYQPMQAYPQQQPPPPPPPPPQQPGYSYQNNYPPR